MRLVELGLNWKVGGVGSKDGKGVIIFGYYPFVAGVKTGGVAVLEREGRFVYYLVSNRQHKILVNLNYRSRVVVKGL